MYTTQLKNNYWYNLHAKMHMCEYYSTVKNLSNRIHTNFK